MGNVQNFENFTFPPNFFFKVWVGYSQFFVGEGYDPSDPPPLHTSLQSLSHIYSFQWVILHIMRSPFIPFHLVNPNFAVKKKEG